MNMLLRLRDELHIVYKKLMYLNLEIGQLSCSSSDTIKCTILSQVVASVILHIPIHIFLISSYDVKYPSYFHVYLEFHHSELRKYHYYIYHNIFNNSDLHS